MVEKKTEKKKNKQSVSKKAVKSDKKKKTAVKTTEPKRYYEAVGRRKRAVARVRLFTCRPFEGNKGRITVNGRPYAEYFSVIGLREAVIDPLKRMKSFNRFKVTIKVKGGGITGQAEAIRHGLSRALVKFNPDFSKKLRRAGFLTRDSRRKERKKPGLKKARRAAQWRKR